MNKVCSQVRFLGIIVVFCSVLLVGCSSSSNPEVVTSGDSSNLQKIQKAYNAYISRTGKGPERLEDLKPFLEKETNIQQLANSPNDGQPYVIIWGVNHLKNPSPQPIVIAYEKTGKGGTRFVFTSVGILEMSEEEFNNAQFANNHKPEK